ncbi:unnamed protein product [Paramecium octaurelia]|uniref:RING-CH-type domain-containing protein n=1 Tax=Paramecium octaurelia TaxID=43137 RepID=A0A8S1UNY8_PAROT|nr:unnamed protein product [Paramecium octaurelia]
MNTDYEDQDENNLDDLENLDISKVIQSKYKQRRVGISQYQQQEHQKVRQNQIAPDLENQPIQQTQINQTTQSDILVSRSDNQVNDQKLITFRCQNNINQQTKEKPKKNQKTCFSSYNQCRICGDGDSDDCPLIKACECVRSRYYVHEECLKQQILDEYNYKIRGAKCSSCQVKFNMIIEGNFIFLPIRLGAKQRQDPIILLDHFLTCTYSDCYFIINQIVNLLIRFRTSIKETKNRQNFLNSKVFIILFIVICCVISIILVWLITMILKNILYVEKITKWKIIPYLIKQPSFVMQQNIEINNKGILKLQQMIQQQEQNHTNEDLTKSEHINTTKTQYKRYFTSMKIKQQESLIS